MLIEEIKKINIVEAIQTLTNSAIQKRGKNYFTFSPYHDERTPSCCLDTKNNRYFDFSTNKGGTIIDFIMEYNSLDLKGAIEYISNAYGLSNNKSNFSKSKITESQIEKEREIKNAERKKKEKNAIRKVNYIYTNGANYVDSWYLEKKGFSRNLDLNSILKTRVLTEWEKANLKLEVQTKYGNALMVPVYNIDNKLINIQYYFQNFNTKGEDRGFHYEAPIDGGMLILNKIDNKYSNSISLGYSGPIIVSEGLATGLSIFRSVNDTNEETLVPVVVAFASGNLLSVVNELINKYYDSKIIICADKDKPTIKNFEIRDILGVGISTAVEIQKEYPDKVIWISPTFNPENDKHVICYDARNRPIQRVYANSHDKYSDYNDLEKEFGSPYCKTQIIQSILEKITNLAILKLNLYNKNKNFNSKSEIYNKIIFCLQENYTQFLPLNIRNNILHLLQDKLSDLSSNIYSSKPPLLFPDIYQWKFNVYTKKIIIDNYNLI